MKAWIALGSNLGNREENLKRALKAMENSGLEILKISSFIRTAPYGNVNQDDFINSVCLVETDETPEELMEILLSIEKNMGRVRKEHWGPRNIDLDLIFYEDEIRNTPRLTLPHPDMQNRRFVLEPLEEISEDKVHPVLKKTVMELLNDLNYNEALQWIEGRARFGIKLGLDNIHAMLHALDNPEKNISCLHIAGTNGKGSVCSYLSHVLEEADYKVGLFTSPFIETFRERFQINHQPISKKDLLEEINIIRPIVEEMEKNNQIPTHFEILTAMCFDYFARQEVDIAVMEVGLGGLYDSTNVIEQPLASIITAIGYDHTEYLGNTLEAIAEQKGGIIKENCPVFVYPNPPEVIRTLKEIADAKNAPFYPVSEETVRVKAISSRGTQLEYQNIPYQLSMVGEHQAYNSALAIETLRSLRKFGKIHFTDDQLKKGLAKAKLIARLELLQTDPQVLLDGSHNIQGIQALEKALEFYEYKELILGVGILKDKRHLEMVQTIVPYASKVVVTEISMDRKLPAENLAEEIRPLGKPVIVQKNIVDALKTSIQLAHKEDLVLWCGSLYLMGEIRKAYFKDIYQ